MRIKSWQSYLVFYTLLLGAAFLAVNFSQPKTKDEKRIAPLFNDLGKHHHAITTKSPLAQKYFDQGLILTYAFNHPEAIRSFKEAVRLDSTCAMAYWGIALALGPNINSSMDPGAVPEAYAMAQKANLLAAQVSENERGYIQALAQRYSLDSTMARETLDLAYANAMREFSQKFPDDLDAATLFAEALMDLNPWNHWDKEGRPDVNTPEIVTTLEAVLRRNPHHPGANHYYIHAVEASPHPEKALVCADRLGSISPGAGHLVHMPAHIYMRTGRYYEASLANEAAAKADESYITQCNRQGFYPAMYYPHNIHFLWASASMEGRSTVAIDAARKLVASIPLQRFHEFSFLEAFLPTPLFALARFSKWHEILAEPKPAPEFKYTTAIWHYVRGLVFASQGKADEAAAEQAQLLALAQNDTIKNLILFGGSNAAALLDIANHTLAGEVAGARGQIDEMIRELWQAAKLQDALPYIEPPPWYLPIRQVIGQALLKAKRAAEAETTFREDLKQNPFNGWSLRGLEQSLRLQGKREEADGVQEQFKQAWSRADVTAAYLSSCCSSDKPQ